MSYYSNCWPDWLRRRPSRHCWGCCSSTAGVSGSVYFSFLHQNILCHVVIQSGPPAPIWELFDLAKHRLNCLWTLSWSCGPWAAFFSLLRERETAWSSVDNWNISLKQFLTNPLLFSKLILNTMVWHCSEDLSSSASHVAGLGQSWAILGNGGKQHFRKTKCLCGPGEQKKQSHNATSIYLCKRNQQSVISRGFVRPPCFLCLALTARRTYLLCSSARQHANSAIHWW